MIKRNLLLVGIISLCVFQAAWSAASGRPIIPALPLYGAGDCEISLWSAASDKVIGSVSHLPFSVLRKHGTADCMIPLEETGPIVSGVVSILERKPGENKKSLFAAKPQEGAVVIGLYVLYKGAGTLRDDLRHQEIVLTQCEDNTPETAELCIETFMPFFRPYKKGIEKMVGLFFYPYDEVGSLAPRKKGYSEDLGHRPVVVSKLMNEIINLDVTYSFVRQDTSRMPLRNDGLSTRTPKSISGDYKHIEVILSYPWMSCVHSCWNFHRKIWFADHRSSSPSNKRRRPRK